MRKKYIILRSLKNSAFEPHTGPSATSPFATAAARSEREAHPLELATTRIDIEELDTPAVARVRGLGDVIAVAPNMPTRLIAPLDASAAAVYPAAASTWGVEAVRASTSPLDGAGIVPAILDTGIESTHAAFRGVNLIENDFTGPGNGDGNGHGTHCAGTAFGRTVGGKRIGVAPGVATALIGKVLDHQGGGSTQSCFEAIQWAANRGANVISMSLGIDFPGYVQQLSDQGVPVPVATSMALEAYRVTVRAYEQLIGFLKARAPMFQTTIVVAAAGNENRPFKNPSWTITVAPPAAAQGFLSVGAVGRAAVDGVLEIAPFSNSGPNFVGPGVAIESAQLGGGLTPLSGTSMATPHVAGVAVLWAQWLRNRQMLTPFNLEAQLAASAVSAPLAAGFEPGDVGLGLVQAPQSA